MVVDLLGQNTRLLLLEFPFFISFGLSHSASLSLSILLARPFRFSMYTFA